MEHQREEEQEEQSQQHQQLETSFGAKYSYSDDADDHLQLAAEIGQTLLVQYNELQERYSLLESQLRDEQSLAHKLHDESKRHQACLASLTSAHAALLDERTELLARVDELEEINRRVKKSDSAGSLLSGFEDRRQSIGKMAAFPPVSKDDEQQAANRQHAMETYLPPSPLSAMLSVEDGSDEGELIRFLETKLMQARDIEEKLRQDLHLANAENIEMKKQQSACEDWQESKRESEKTIRALRERLDQLGLGHKQLQEKSTRQGEEYDAVRGELLEAQYLIAQLQEEAVHATALLHEIQSGSAHPEPAHKNRSNSFNHHERDGLHELRLDLDLGLLGLSKSHEHHPSTGQLQTTDPAPEAEPNSNDVRFVNKSVDAGDGGESPAGYLSVPVETLVQLGNIAQTFYRRLKDTETVQLHRRLRMPFDSERAFAFSTNLITECLADIESSTLSTSPVPTADALMVMLREIASLRRLSNELSQAYFDRVDTRSREELRALVHEHRSQLVPTSKSITARRFGLLDFFSQLNFWRRSPSTATLDNHHSMYSSATIDP